MDGTTLYDQRQQAINSLKNSMEKFYQNGVAYAEANRIYRQTMRQKVLALKAEGYAVTLIERLAKGDADVAEAEFNKNVAETLYKASAENINIQKLILRSLEEEIAREWRA